MTQERIARNAAVRLLGEDEYLQQNNPAALERWHQWHMRMTINKILREMTADVKDYLYSPTPLLDLFTKGTLTVQHSVIAGKPHIWTVKQSETI